MKVCLFIMKQDRKFIEVFGYIRFCSKFLQKEIKIHKNFKVVLQTFRFFCFEINNKFPGKIWSLVLQPVQSERFQILP